MAITVKACRVCSEQTERYLRGQKAIPTFHKRVNADSSTSFEINIAGDPRKAAPKSLLAMAWSKCKELKFQFHDTRLTGNVIHCSGTA